MIIHGHIPVRWSFDQQLIARFEDHPDEWITRFYRSDSVRVSDRFDYTLEDARSLIEYLNSRS